jgi:predicted RNase H-like nuclease
MIAVLGIDAAWTERNASGYALAEKHAGRWRLRVAAPNLQKFAEECGLGGEEGQGADFALRCAEHALGGRLPDLVAVDMPLSRKKIERRRKSDDAISQRFGAAKCATHSPSKDRPGDVSAKLRAACEARDYVLVTSPPVSAARSLAEVYPHPALLRLMKVDERVRYKVNKTTAYWREQKNPEVRLSLLKETLSSIAGALDTVIAGTRRELGRQFDFESAKGFSALKPLEDTIDAIISAWVGTTILEGAAEPFGGDDSAIWVPKETRAKLH